LCESAARRDTAPDPRTRPAVAVCHVVYGLRIVPRSCVVFQRLGAARRVRRAPPSSDPYCL